MKSLREWQADKKISNLKLAEILNVTHVMVSIYRSSDDYFVADDGQIFKKVRRLKGIKKAGL